MKNKINKEDYLKLLDAVLKEQQIEDLEVNKEYLEEVERPIPKRFLYVEGQGTIHATDMTREQINAVWKNQGNIIVGNFLLKVSSFIPIDGRSNEEWIQFHLYDYEKDEKGKVMSTKIEIYNDIRFTDWKNLTDKKMKPINASINTTLDMIEWLQKLDRLGAFI